MAEKKVQLSKKDRLSVALRSTFLQGSWNYERMQNGGWCFAMIPAIKKLYTTKEDQIAALKRHLEFFNTHPYVASPVIGVTLALEEERLTGIRGVFSLSDFRCLYQRDGETIQRFLKHLDRKSTRLNSSHIL